MRKRRNAKRVRTFALPAMAGGEDAAIPDPFAGWKGAIWVHCERCKQDRKLAADVQVPQGFWYCEFNPDASAERCLPSANVPLRAKSPGEPTSCFDPLRYNSLKFGSESSS